MVTSTCWQILMGTEEALQLVFKGGVHWRSKVIALIFARRNQRALWKLVG